MQPYQTGDFHHPLWLLNKLWNVDKHPTLHVTGLMFSHERDDLAQPMGYTGWSSHTAKPLRQRVEIVRSVGTFNDRLEEQVDANNRMTRDVALGKTDEPASDSPWTLDYPFTNLPLRPVLRNIRRYVADEIIVPVGALLA